MSDEPAADPLADLMFTLAAVLLIAIAVVLAAAPARRAAGAPRWQGEAVEPIYAVAAGLRWGAGAARLTPLDAIADDSDLRAYLAAMAARKGAASLVIADEGREAAFELEPLLAKAGVAEVRQVRLGPCDGASACPRR